jgi:hypothetical protein
VLLKHIQCVLVVLHLAERKFVNDRIVRINDNAWRYPRLATSQPPGHGEAKCEVRLPREQNSLH